jgi:hypothetical protein
MAPIHQYSVIVVMWLSLFLLVVGTAIGKEEEDQCRDNRRACVKSAREGECRRQPELMYRLCPLSCKLCESMERTTEFGVQQVMLGREASELFQIVKETRKYVDSDAVLDLEPEIFLDCWNHHADCSSWALRGECETNKVWMKVNCGPTCQSCHMMTMESLERNGVNKSRQRTL